MTDKLNRPETNNNNSGTKVEFAPLHEQLNDLRERQSAEENNPPADTGVESPDPSLAAAQPEPVEEDPNRTKDFGLAVAHGANNVAKSAFDIWKAAGGAINSALSLPQSGLERAARGLGFDEAADTLDRTNIFKQGARYFREGSAEDLALNTMFEENDQIYSQAKSEDLQRRKAELDAEVEAADTEWKKGYARFKGTLTDLPVAADFIGTQLPQLLATGVSGAVGKQAALKLGASKAAANKAATGTAVVAGAGMQASSVASETIQAVNGELIEVSEMTPEELDDYIIENPSMQALVDRKIELAEEGLSDKQINGTIARELSQEAAISSFFISMLVSRIPGATKLEQTLSGAGSAARSRIASAVSGAVGEGLSEAIEEGSGQLLQNRAVGEVNPDQELFEGVGSAAGEGAASVVFGGAAGAVQGVDHGIENPNNVTDLRDAKVIDGKLVNAGKNERSYARETPPESDANYTGKEKRVDTSRREKIAAMSAEDIESELYRNDLTGVLNRRAFNEDIENATEVVSIDVDALKSTNDYASPEAGDQLLKNAGSALDQVFGSSAYHISGDEFYVLDGGENVREKLEEVRSILSETKIEANKNGKKVEIDGANFTYGIADNKDDADTDMKNAKIDRTKKGKRTNRGELPSNVKYFDDDGSELSAALDESGELILAGNQGIVPNISAETKEGNEDGQDGQHEENSSGVSRSGNEEADGRGTSTSQSTDGSHSGTDEGRREGSSRGTERRDEVRERVEEGGDSSNVRPGTGDDQRIGEESQRERSVRSGTGGEPGSQRSGNGTELDNATESQAASRSELDGSSERQRVVQGKGSETLSRASESVKQRREAKQKQEGKDSVLKHRVLSIASKANSKAEYNEAINNLNKYEYEAIRRLGGASKLFREAQQNNVAKETKKLGDIPRTQRHERVAKYNPVQKKAFDTVTKGSKDFEIHTDVNSLPLELRKDIPRGGKPRGVYNSRDGKVHVIASNLATARDVRRVLVHETIHMGLHKKHGKELTQRMSELSDSLGGLEGITALAEKNNINLDQYLSHYEDNPFVGAVMAEELIAHIAEKEPSGPVKTIARKIVKLYKKALGNYGINDVREDEIISIIRSAKRVATRDNTKDNVSKFSLDSLEYPLPKRDDWLFNRQFEETGGRLVWMSPTQYLNSVKELVIDEESRETIDGLKDRMEKGLDVDPLQINTDGKEDGRHRANAARELGIKQVPVIDYRRSDDFKRDYNSEFIYVDADGNVPLIHFSKEKFKRTDPGKFGTSGIRGAERTRQNEPNYTPSTYFGLPGYKKESGLGANAYTASIPAHSLYDFRGDPEGIVARSTRYDKYSKMTKRDTNLAERNIKRAGYKGYFTDQFNYAVVFEALDVTPTKPMAAGKVFPIPEPQREAAAYHLYGMPKSVKVDGKDRETTGFKTAQDIADKYIADNNIEAVTPKLYAKVDEKRAKRIADAYDKMEHNPSDPEVLEAYIAMRDETYAQYRAILEGHPDLVIEFFPDGKDTYGNPRNATQDAVENNHLYIFPTVSGYGSNDTDIDVSDNPLLEESPFKFGDQPALANDIFRAVHDYFGHIKDGNGFRARGEEHAWRSHSAMYTPKARRAMTSKTRGQNSWVNFGPHAKANKTASGEDTVFADQKIGLLPKWVATEGAKDNATELALATKFALEAPKRESSGRYVGAPNWIGKSPAKLGKFRRTMTQLFKEGEPGKYWYEDSSKAILSMVGGDRVEAEKVVGLIAIYSANANVKANTTKALKAYFQYQAGEPIAAATKNQDEKAKRLLEKGEFWKGIKTNAFYQNLMVHIDRSKLDPEAATMDMWMAIAGRYDKKTLDQGPQYNFLNNEILRIATNEGVEPWQVQASIWTAIKSRVEDIRKPLRNEEIKKGILEVDADGKQTKRDDKAHYTLAHDVAMRAKAPNPETIEKSRYDFSHALAERNSHMVNDVAPGHSTGVLPGLHEASTEQRANYLRDIEAVITEGGSNRIAKAIGMSVPESEMGYSTWQGERGAGEQTFIPIAIDRKAQFKGEDGKPFKGTGLTDAARKMITLYAAMKGAVLKQDRVVWHYPVYDEAKSRQNSFEIISSKPFTANEVDILNQRVSGKFDTDNILILESSNGIRILNFENTGVRNRAFQKGMQEVLDTMLGTGVIEQNVKVNSYRSTGEVLENNWKENPNGEGYLQRFIEEGRSDLQEATSDIAADIDRVNARYAEEFGQERTGSKFALKQKKTKRFSAIHGKAKRNINVSRKRVKRFLKRNLTTRGLLDIKNIVPEDIMGNFDTPFELKNKVDGMKAVGEKNIEFYLQFMRNAMHRGYGKNNRLKDSHFRYVNNYLAGGGTQFVPKHIRKDLDELRAYIDVLSEGVMDTIKDRIIIAEDKLTEDQHREYELALSTGGQQGYIPVALRKHLEMLDVIEANKGEYLHRSYAAFDDPKWIDDVKENRPKLIANAEAFIQEENPDMSAEEVSGVVSNIMREAQKSSDITGFMTRGSKYGSKDVSVLKRRKEVPEPLRELLGEYKDARVNFTKTATKLNYIIANHHFLTSLRDSLYGVALFDKPIKLDEARDFNTRLASKNSDTMNPLDGLYTTTDFDQGLQDIMETTRAGGVMRAMMATNSMVKYGKTIISPATQIANFISGVWFTIGNGHLFSLAGVKAGAKAGSVTMADIAGENAFGRFVGKKFDSNWSADKYKDYINDLIEKGVLHNSPNSTEMRKAIEDFMEFNTTTEGASHPKNILKFMQKTYQLGDDFWKVIGYESEKASKLKAGFDLRKAERIAADRIVNGYPTYSMVPRLIQQIRKWWLVGTFVSFPYEMGRTTINQFRFLAEDFKSDKPAFARRGLGLAVAHSAFIGLSTISMLNNGVDDEDDEAIRALLPPWSRNATLYYTGYDENGMLTYVDMSRYNPYGYVQKPFQALVNGNNKGATKKILDATKELSEPFIGPEITASALVEIYSNQRIGMYGKIFNPDDSMWEQNKSKFNHLRRNMQPTILSQLENVYQASQGRVKGAKQMTMADETLAIAGFRGSTMNIANAIKYKAYGFKSSKANSTKILSQVAKRTGDVSESDLRGAFDRMMLARNRTFSTMHGYVDIARKLGMTDNEIKSLLRSKAIKVGKADTRHLLEGTIPKWKPSRDWLSFDTDPSNKALDQKKLTRRKNERLDLINKWLKEE